MSTPKRVRHSQNAKRRCSARPNSHMVCDRRRDFRQGVRRAGDLLKFLVLEFLIAGSLLLAAYRLFSAEWNAAFDSPCRDGWEFRVLVLNSGEFTRDSFLNVEKDFHARSTIFFGQAVHSGGARYGIGDSDTPCRLERLEGANTSP
jgi:hypothetical protein